jgi:hypothetical protein
MADLSDLRHSSLFPAPQWIECRRRPTCGLHEVS